MISFSIVMPVYNAAAFLDQSVQSVLNQKDADFELIMVDDASTDNSWKLMQDYEKADSRIHALKIEPLGVSRAREAAILKAAKDYVVFLDADDGLKENALHILSMAIEESQADCIIYDFERGTSISACKTSAGDALKNLRVITDPKELFRIILFSNTFNTLWRKAIKRQLVQQVDVAPFEKYKFGEDLLHSLYFLHLCKSAAFIDNVLYSYVINPKSVTESISFETYVPDYSVRQDVLKLIEQWNLLDEKDMEVYRGVCADIIARRLMDIETWNTSAKNKKSVFERIRNTDYVRDFLLNQPMDKSPMKKRAVLFDLFAAGQDTRLLWALKAYNMLLKAKEGRKNG